MRKILGLHRCQRIFGVAKVRSLISVQKSCNIPRSKAHTPWPSVRVYDVLVGLVESWVIYAHGVVEQFLSIFQTSVTARSHENIDLDLLADNLVFWGVGEADTEVASATVAGKSNCKRIFESSTRKAKVPSPQRRDATDKYIHSPSSDRQCIAFHPYPAIGDVA
jgi:hypothetical protein